MDVFALRNRLVDDYASYIESFITIRDDRIRQYVDDELRNGLLWPEPLLQLNPSFEPGPWIDDLVASGRLHPECQSIFRIKKPGQADKPLRLHTHQGEAVQAAASGDSYVLTTGTGSGKSLAYIIPIVDFVLRKGSGKGIRAIVVYPMNALANSQAKELEKFLCLGYPEGKPPVTFRRYTGQEQDEERQEILANPPDILLTNYVMLELLLTRPYEKKIVNAARERLQFLVLDEMHTYRGRQGADVAMLVRRVRDVCANPHLQCVGTSATLAGSGSFADQQRQIAEVASRFFGAAVKPERIIGETLRRVTVETDLADAATLDQLKTIVATRTDKPSLDFASFKTDPLAAWIETTFGLATEAETGRLKRATPIGVSGPQGAARQLAALIDMPEAQCRQAIQHTLMAGYDAVHPETGFPVFAFRLHQFISRGDTVYASLEDPDKRHVTTQGQQFVPGDRSRILLGVAFCRECGQEYYTVFRQTDPKSGEIIYLPRRVNDQTGDKDQQAGFLYASQQSPWPDNEQDIVERLPEDWLENTASGLRVKKANRNRLPQAVQVSTEGKESASGDPYHFIKAPFHFCLACGVAYSGRQQSDYGKLAVLSSEGRSTATTILSIATLQSLRQDTDLDKEARKLLSFTDNRQDASLQAGHFNDFVEVGMLRTALQQAVQAAGADGITHEVLPLRVFDALKLPIELYASDPTVKFQQRVETDRALREVLAYRIYQDLRRGWRVTSPNLEQCGLLKIDYSSLQELCEAQEEWSGCHPALADATPATRAEISKTLLDYLRRELAIKVDYLDPVRQESLRQLSSQRLREPWAIDESEQLVRSFLAFPRSRRQNDDSYDSREHVYVSGRGGFGLYLRRPGTLPHFHDKLSVEETEKVIVQLFQVLRVAGLVEPVYEPAGANDVPGYMIPASALVWKAGDGSEPLRDIIRVPRASAMGSRTNPYFIGFYRQPTGRLHELRAKEHTAQVQSDERQKREDLFRTAELPLLYCSPTMELGVDIAQLNSLNMRNVPPTPANYAQRSGRAGRSGQPALVFTYCTTGSPHDQYFFKRPQQMVSGAVTPPRIDLANEDLVRAHVHAVWLAETGQALGTSLKDILDLDGETPTLKVLPSVQAAIASGNARGQGKSAPAGYPGQPAGRIAAGRLVFEGLARPHLGAGRGGVRPGLQPLARPVPLGAQTARGAEQGHRRCLAQPARQGPGQAPARRGRGPDGAAHRQRQSVPVRLLQLPLFRQRGLPARLQLPAPAAVGLHPGPAPGQERARRVSQPAALPGDLRVWPAQHHLPRGLALRGEQGHPARRRAKRPRPGHHQRQAVPQLRPPAPAAGGPGQPGPLRAMQRAAGPAAHHADADGKRLHPAARPHQLGRGRAHAHGLRADHRGAPGARRQPHHHPPGHGPRRGWRRAAAADLRPCGHALAHQQGLAATQA